MLAPASDHVLLLADLARALPEPFGILYVLVVSRAGHDEARYQCPAPVDRGQALAFLDAYRDFLEHDGRHNIWLMSLPSKTTLVYDRHQLIHAYGDLASIEQAAAPRGLVEGEVDIPVPHAHQYHDAYDQAGHAIISHWQWRAFPLQDQDC